MKRALFLLLIGTALSIPALSSNLSGRVVDPSGAVVPDAGVRLYTRDNSVRLETRTDVEGRYSFNNLPGGEFLLEAASGDLIQADKKTIVLAQDQAATADLTLVIAGISTHVMVTASAAAQSTLEIAKAVDTLDRPSLDRRAVFSLSEALRDVPGLRVQQLGGPGSFTRIQIRGLRAVDTAMLIDGVRFRDAASVQGDAAAFLGDIMTAGSDRVEVLRGTGSSLYGSHATAGVVNLVTDHGGGPIHGELDGEGGGLGLFRGTAKVSGSALRDRLPFSLAVTELNVAGGIDGIESVHNTGGQAFVQYRLNPKSTLSARLFGGTSNIGLTTNPVAAPEGTLPASGIVQAIPLAESQVLRGDQGLPFAWNGATFAPNFYDPDASRDANFFSGLFEWNQRFSSTAAMRVNYHTLVSDRANTDGPAGYGYQPMYNSYSGFHGRIDTLQARTDLQLGRVHLLSAGYEWERESFDSPSTDQNPDPSQRIDARTTAAQRSNSAFIYDQMRWLNDRLQVSLSGRFQSFTLETPQFYGGAPQYVGAALDSPPNAYTGDASAAYLLNHSGTKLRAHAGNGYRAPALYERFGSYFFYGAFTALGDPRLSPERTVAIDGGVDQYFSGTRYRVSATYFYTRLQSVIGFGYLNGDPFGRWGGYINTGGGLARGVELSFEGKPWRSMNLQSSYTYTNADEKTSSLVDGSLSCIRIFPNAFTVVATQSIGRRWTVTADFFGAGSYVSGVFFVGSGNRPFLFPGPRKLAGVVEYSLPLGETHSLRFFTRVENMLNQRYFEDGFRTPAIWASAGARFVF
jgi:vitamin B12 transporter